MPQPETYAEILERIPVSYGKMAEWLDTATAQRDQWKRTSEVLLEENRKLRDALAPLAAIRIDPEVAGAYVPIDWADIERARKALGMEARG